MKASEIKRGHSVKIGISTYKVLEVKSPNPANPKRGTEAVSRFQLLSAVGTVTQWDVGSDEEVNAWCLKN